MPSASRHYLWSYSCSFNTKYSWALLLCCLPAGRGERHSKSKTPLLVADSERLTACPNDCSFHGLCIGSECECDPGWSGEDCSYPVMAFVSFGIRSIYPPSGIALGGTNVRLSVFNIANRSKLACRFTPVGNGSAIIVPAMFHSSTLVSCRAPPSALAPSLDQHDDAGYPPPPPAGTGEQPKEQQQQHSSAQAGVAVSVDGRQLRAAMKTPEAEYYVELAEEPPVFSNNMLRFFQWDAALTSAQPAGGAFISLQPDSIPDLLWPPLATAEHC